MPDFSNKTAIVTGAAHGIGRGIALEFLRRGARVTACDIDADALALAFGGSANCTLRVLDVGESEAWDALVAAWEGPLDYMVNSAGVIRPGFLVETEARDVRLQIGVNLEGVIFGTQAAARIMCERDGGHIINLASLAGIAPVSGLGVYTATKFGVRGFSLAMAQELDDRGIAVSVVAPDAVDTHMLDDQMGTDAAVLTFSGDRILTVEDVVEVVFEDVIAKRKTEVWIPKARGVQAQVAATFPGLAARMFDTLRTKGSRQQAEFRDQRERQAGAASAKTELEADYLVVGAGAMGLAFTDELIHRDPSAQVIIIDRRAGPGGHWNDAYSFVSLHQPAAYYGVNSLPLGAGGAALATGAEVLTYFERVLERLLASGRVRHFPLSDYEGEGRFRSTTKPDEVHTVHVRRKIVDATYMKVEVPATTPPKYAAAPEVALVPVNAIVDHPAPAGGYVIVGAGKTGIDAILYLLGRGVAPEAITWIVSNDSWLLRREEIQPGVLLGSYVAQVELFTRCSTLEILVAELESIGVFCRIDPSVTPTKYRCATVSEAELVALRRLRNIVRLGRIVRIEPDSIVLERGTVAADPQALYVDCTADGLAKRPVRPVFEGSTITLQSLLMCQQVFSASLIAYIETHYADEAKKNALSQVVPHPEWTRDYVSTIRTSLANIAKWGRELRSWMASSRLCFASHESQLDVLLASVRLAGLEAQAERQLGQIEAHEGRASEGTVVLDHGPLRFTTHVAGLDQPRSQPCVVCLHGFPDSARSFRHQLPALASAGYRVYAPTMRGYEPSSQPADADYSIAALASDVIAWLDDLGEDQVHLVGHDWGAVAAYTAGALAPQRFRTLTTIAVPPLSRFMAGVREVPVQLRKSWYMLFLQLPAVAEAVVERDDWALLRRLWADWSPGFTLPEDEWASLRETFAAPGVKRAMLSYYRQNISPGAVLGFQADAGQVPVPTLAISGADGCIDTTLYDHTVREADFPAGVRVERIASAGHFVHQERPEIINELLLDWLSQDS